MDHLGIERRLHAAARREASAAQSGEDRDDCNNGYSVIARRQAASTIQQKGDRIAHRRRGVLGSIRNMTRQQFLHSMDKLLELPRGTLTGDEKLHDLEQWNSMAMISFIALADTNNRIGVSASQI